MRRALVVAASMLFAATAQAQYVTKYAVSGQPIRLYFAYSTNPDCSAVGQPTVRLTGGPQHGRVTITRVNDYPNFPATNVRVVCDRRRVPGVMVQYVSQRGYVGMDAASIEIIYPSGTLRQPSFSINVR